TDQRMDALPMLPPVLSFQKDDWMFSSVFLSPPPLDKVPDMLPTVASTLARWDAYQHTQGESETANGWAFLVFCILDCDWSNAQVNAGHDAIADWYFGSNANAPVQP